MDKDHRPQAAAAAAAAAGPPPEAPERTAGQIGEAVRNGWRVQVVHGGPAELSYVPPDAWAGVNRVGVKLPYGGWDGMQESQLSQLASGLESGPDVSITTSKQHKPPPHQLLRVASCIWDSEADAMSDPAYSAAVAASGMQHLRFMGCTLPALCCLPASLAQQVQELELHMKWGWLHHFLALPPGSFPSLRVLNFSMAGNQHGLSSSLAVHRMDAEHATALAAAAPALRVVRTDFRVPLHSYSFITQLHAALPELQLKEPR